MHFKGVNNRGYLKVYYNIKFCVIQSVWSFLCAPFFATRFNDTILKLKLVSKI